MEKVYKSMKNVGGANIALGVVAIVAGIALGVISIVTGAKLLRDKADITF